MEHTSQQLEFLYKKLDTIEQEIKAIESSDEYKALSRKNRAWAAPKPSEEEKGEWTLLKEKIDDLKKKEEFYQKAILSTNTYQVKKADSTRKKYKEDLAAMDERLFLSTITKRIKTGFKNNFCVREYFRKRAAGMAEPDRIKDSNTEDEWIKMLEMSKYANHILQDEMVKKADGTYRLVLESNLYKGNVDLFEGLVSKWCPGKKVDIKDAASDSSQNPVEDVVVVQCDMTFMRPSYVPIHLTREQTKYNEKYGLRMLFLCCSFRDRVVLINKSDQWHPILLLILQDEMVKKADGTYRLVLESNLYKGNVDLFEGLVSKWCPGKKVDIKDAASDSSQNP
ncbi:hypothetical protein MP638_006688, partial [Amoeboaphelidium occidentale]